MGGKKSKIKSQGEEAEIDLAGKGLELIPSGPSFQIPKDVCILNLKGNKLKDLPDTVYKQTSLKKINLSDNKFSVIPENLFELVNLKIISLNDNTLNSLPFEWDRVTFLQKLTAKNNSLKIIPAQIITLRNLTTIKLSFNKITIIPDEISQMTQLTDLHLDDNNIKKIPTSLSKLVNLNTLYLNGNDLEFIPSELHVLVKLRELPLHNNPNLESPPPKTCFTGKDAILAYLKAQYKQKEKGIAVRDGSQIEEKPEELNIENLSLLTFLDEPHQAENFKQFLANEFSLDNLLFWEASENLCKRELLRDSDTQNLKSDAKKIFDTFVSEEGSKQVNLSSKDRNTIRDIVYENHGDNIYREMYKTAADHLLVLIEKDTFARYKATKMK